MKAKITIAVLILLFTIGYGFLIFKVEAEQKKSSDLTQSYQTQKELVDAYKTSLHYADTLLVDFNRELAERLQSGQISPKDAAYLLQEVANNWTKTK